MERRSSKIDERLQWLATCPLFDSLPEPDLRSLAGIASLRAYEKGEVIFMQEEKAQAFYIIAEGKVKVCRFADDGREQVLHLFDAGEPVGEVPVFQGGRYPASALAQKETLVLHIPMDKFFDLGQEHPEVLMDMLACLSLRLRNFVRLIDDLALKEVSARLAKMLLDLNARSGETDTFELEMTKTMLASRIGTVAETLSRTLKKMQKRGIITVEGKKFTIHDHETLQQLAAGMKL